MPFDFPRPDLPALAALLLAPSTFAQVGIVLAAFLVGRFLGGLIEKPLEAQARHIRNAPQALRVVIAFLRRLRLAGFVAVIGIASASVRIDGMRLPALAIVFKLSLAYLVIAVASRALRNRLAARMVTVVAWTLAALSILGWADTVAEDLDAAALQVGATRISLLLTLKAVGVVVVAVWFAGHVGRLIDARVQHSTELTPTLRVLIGKFLRIGLICLSLAVALGLVGVDLSALTLLSGAIGVGLGFGLQKVVSNFVSGIIILVDRSIKPGDTISLGSTFGWVRELRARFVSVITRDGREYLIPNEKFVTDQVINWSFTDDLVRIDAVFRVAYGSDPHHVTRVAKEAALGVERVVTDKGAVCWITEFGEYSLHFILRFWISDPQNGLTNVKGQVLLALWDAFKAHGIEIPYPRRDVRILSDPASDGSR